MMPMHDWTKVEPTIYHHFHQSWTVAITTLLNSGPLPRGYSALVEQHAKGLVPDVLALERNRGKSESTSKGVAVGEPRTRIKVRSEASILVRKANRIAIRHRMGEVVCIIEIVSPGNKAGEAAIDKFVRKTCDFMRSGVNVLLVDPFPPTKRDPHSLHKLIWDHVEDVPFKMPKKEPLLLASYQVTDKTMDLDPQAYIEPFAVGAKMPDMPAWLTEDLYVNVPLEQSYMQAWNVCPSDYRYLVEHGKMPDE